MKCHFMDEVVFTVGEDGVLEIRWSEDGCRYRRLITSKNPISHLYVSESSLHFRFYGSRDIYQMLWGWVKKCEKCPDRLMFWSGDGVDVPARTLYFVADLVRETLYVFYHGMGKAPGEPEPKHLKKRYRQCSHYIDRLDLKCIAEKIRERQKTGVF